MSSRIPKTGNLTFLKHFDPCCAASREFGVAESNIRLWRKQRSELEEMPRTKQARRGKQALYPDLEKGLVDWVESQRKNRYIVTCFHVQLQARKMSKDVKYGVSENFKVSNGWCQKFMKRHSLALRQRTKISQKLPKDLDEKITKFHTFVLNLRKKHDFNLDQIGNMDETPMFFDMPGNRTLDKVGNKTVYVRTTGHEKTHFTVVLCCMADGTKLQPMVIFKRKTIPKGEKFPPGVLVHCHEKGWMDEDGITLWLEKVWNKRPGALLKKPAMLVWDQFRAHLTEPVKKKLDKLKTQQAVIPGGLTSVLQPLDVCLNKPFKDHVRKNWISWMGSHQVERTAGGNLKKPGLSTVVTWVKEAWDSLPDSMVSRSFLKTGISNRMDGSEDDLLWEECPASESDDENDFEVTDTTGWDTDEKFTRKEWEQLFGVSDDDESDFEGF